MQIQFITTDEELQSFIGIAINKAFGELTVNAIQGHDLVEIIDTKELCIRLNITEPTVIRWRKKGKIPFLQIGSAVRFNYSNVISALEVGKRKGART